MPELHQTRLYIDGDIVDAAEAGTVEVIDAAGHVWSTLSRHPTSKGTVSYQRCRCGRWRVLLGPNPVLAAQPGGRAPDNKCPIRRPTPLSIRT
jgi:hypothetical protein